MSRGWQVRVDAVDAGPGEVCVRLGGPYRALPEAVEFDTTVRVSEPDYRRWTDAELREVSAAAGLVVDGDRAELIARLQRLDLDEP